MPLYPYSYTHAGGNGDGRVEADTKADAKKIITKSLRNAETKEYKYENLDVTIGDQIKEEVENV